jgi:hypothetical protein
MSRWTIAFASFSVIAFSFAAIAADDSLPRNIELKPGGAPAETPQANPPRTQVPARPRDKSSPSQPMPRPRRRPLALLRPERHRLAKPGNVVLEVQTELKRVGCDPGVADVVWGGHFAKVNVGNLAPTPEILGVIKAKTAVVCVAEGAGPPPAVHQAEPVPLHEQRYGGGYGGGGGGGY